MSIRLLFLCLLGIFLVPALKVVGQSPMPGYLPGRAVVPQTPNSNSAPEIIGRSAIAIDVRTGRVLYEKNSTFRQPAASTQKLLTALLVIEDGDLLQRVTITNADTQCEPSKVYLQAGESYTRLQLLQGLLVHSGNDCARALARDNAGSIPEFAAKMNRRATELGAYNSHFVNPNGLPATGQYSCARDIAIIARSAYRNGVIRRIVSMKTLDFARPGRGVVTFKNTNKLLRSVAFCNGMKTGYTELAGFCLVSSGQSENRDAIVVILHSTKPGIVTDSQRLLSWALGI